MSGRFITFEGVDGCGKSTQAGLLADALRRDGRTVIETREPGGTALGEDIRSLLLNDGDVDPMSEALLFAAARAQHVRELIRPARARGDWIVCDRFLDSSLAYQGAARGLGIHVVEAINRPAVDGMLPDLTILLTVPVEVTSERRRDERSDRIEAEGRDFQRRVGAAFDEIAHLNPHRVTVIDGDDTEESVHAQVMRAVETMA